MSVDSPAVRFSSGLYGMVLRLYPRTFQLRYRDETLRVFRDDCRASLATGGQLALVQLWLRSLNDVLGCAAGEHLAEWTSEHPAQRRSARGQALLTILLGLGVVAVFLTDMNTPPETPMAVMYACALFAAGALLPPRLAALIGIATLSVYVVDGWVAASGWSGYRLLGLVALLAAGTWALRTGADHARLRAASVSSSPSRTSSSLLAQGVLSPALEAGSPASPEQAIRLLRLLAADATTLTTDDLVRVLNASIAAFETASGAVKESSGSANGDLPAP